MVVDMMPFMGAMFGGPSATAESVRPMAEQMRQGMAPRTGDGAAPADRADDRRHGPHRERCAPALVEQSLASDPAVVGAGHVRSDRHRPAGPSSRSIRVPLTVLYVLPAGAPVTPGADRRHSMPPPMPARRRRCVRRIPDSYHFIMFDQPEVFQRELRASLAERADEAAVPPHAASHRRLRVGPGDRQAGDARRRSREPWPSDSGPLCPGKPCESPGSCNWKSPDRAATNRPRSISTGSGMSAAREPTRIVRLPLPISSRRSRSRSSEQPAVVRGQLRIMVRTVDYCAETSRIFREHGQEAPLIRGGPADLCTLLVADYPNTMRVLRPDDLPSLGLSAEEAWALAARQTLDSLPDPPALVFEEGGYAIVTGRELCANDHPRRSGLARARLGPGRNPDGRTRGWSRRGCARGRGRSVRSSRCDTTRRRRGRAADLAQHLPLERARLGGRPGMNAPA